MNRTAVRTGSRNGFLKRDGAVRLIRDIIKSCKTILRDDARITEGGTAEIEVSVLEEMKLERTRGGVADDNRLCDIGFQRGNTGQMIINQNGNRRVGGSVQRPHAARAVVKVDLRETEKINGAVYVILRHVVDAEPKPLLVQLILPGDGPVIHANQARSPANRTDAHR